MAQQSAAIPGRGIPHQPTQSNLIIVFCFSLAFKVLLWGVAETLKHTFQNLSRLPFFLPNLHQMIQNPNPVTDNDSSSIMQGQYEVDLVAVAFIGRPCQRVKIHQLWKKTKQSKTRPRLPLRICSFDSILIAFNISLVTTDKISFCIQHFLPAVAWDIQEVHYQRNHPFKTSTFFRGGEVSKIYQICRRIVVKKMPTEGERGQKSWKFADVLNGWSQIWLNSTRSTFVIRLLNELKTQEMKIWIRLFNEFDSIEKSFVGLLCGIPGLSK